jgi:tetratricopeptide (TPR) repeat protein/arylsulfatase A-like enzyme
MIDHSAASPLRRILLIGWDAADWQMIDPLIEAGQMPVLEKLINEGVMGNLATLQPAISPMLWTSIATGKTADKHGILGFAESDPTTGEPRPFSSVSRRTKAIWNIFQQALGWRCHVANWWASHPAEPLDGIMVSNFFFATRRVGPNTWRVPMRSIHPEGLEAEFGPMRMGINEVTEHLVLPFIPKAAEIDQKSDVRLERLAWLLSDVGSQHAIATALLEREPWQFAAVYYDAIDHFSHGFMPYHPPRQEHISEKDFDMYREVMTSAYRFHDLMLARLLELAGPQTTIVLCSDHGFQSGILRPRDNPREPAGPTFWHRDFGILVMKGPGIKRDERIYGANLLDIAPTLLTLAGLPIGQDMDGKPLLDALENPIEPKTIPSWDAVAGHDGCHPPDFQWSMATGEADEIMQQFAALGYIDQLPADRQLAGEKTEMENQYGLAEVYLSKGQTSKAVPILEELVAQQPWESRYIHQLANAYLKGGWYRAAQDLLLKAYPREDTDATVPVIVWLMRVKARLRRSDRAGAEKLLRGVMQYMLRHPAIWVEAGWLWVELQRYDEAEKCFRRALELHPDEAAAFQGLSTLHLRRRENVEAIDAALEAVQRLYHLPVAHLNLGIALVREGHHAEAEIAFRRAVQMKPDMIAAHRWLGALYATKRPDDFLAAAHRNHARQISRDRSTTGSARRQRAEETRPIPDIPVFAERRRLEKEARPEPIIAATANRTFTIVSGLPRSGTSLMMQMLAAGGLPPKTDGIREADVDNPAGYLEWEEIKRIGQDPSLLDAPDLDKKAIKVISALLTSLPKVHNYRVIYMRRPISEIVASQEKMLQHRGKSEEAVDSKQIASTLKSHAESTLRFLRNQPETFQLLELDYPSLVTNTEEIVGRVAEFLGSDLLPHPERLASAVRKDLYRNKV